MGKMFDEDSTVICPLPLPVNQYYYDAYITSDGLVPVRVAAARSGVKRIRLCGSLAHNVI